MKALTVFEKLNFERGGEPIKQMGIGKQVEDQKLIDNIDWSIWLDTIKSQYDIVEFIRDYRGLPILILKEKGKEDTSWPYRGVSRKIRPNADVKRIIGEFCFSPEQALREIKEKINHWVDNGYIKESQEFTREGNPLEKMDIGFQKIPPAEELLKGQKWANYEVLYKSQMFIDVANNPAKSLPFRKYTKWVILNGNYNNFSQNMTVREWIEENQKSITLRDIYSLINDIWSSDGSYEKHACLQYAIRLNIKP